MISPSSVVIILCLIYTIAFALPPPILYQHPLLEHPLSPSNTHHATCFSQPAATMFVMPAEDAPRIVAMTLCRRYSRYHWSMRYFFNFGDDDRTSRWFDGNRCDQYHMTFVPGRKSTACLNPLRGDLEEEILGLCQDPLNVISDECGRVGGWIENQCGTWSMRSKRSIDIAEGGYKQFGVYD